MRSTEDLQHPAINECIGLFFQWHYPFCEIIHRDTLLHDQFRDTSDNKIRSLALINAVCALGALTSSDKDTKDLADSFCASAENAVMQGILWDPHITYIQALFCCSIYEAGKGEVSKSWMLSGMITPRLTDRITDGRRDGVPYGSRPWY